MTHTITAQTSVIFKTHTQQIINRILVLFSYPPSVLPKGGNTRAAPARWAGERGERVGCEGDGAASSFCLSFSSFPLFSSVSSPPPVASPPVLLFKWALGSKLGTLSILFKCLPFVSLYILWKMKLRCLQVRLQGLNQGTQGLSERWEEENRLPWVLAAHLQNPNPFA